MPSEYADNTAVRSLLKGEEMLHNAERVSRSYEYNIVPHCYRGSAHF